MADSDILNIVNENDEIVGVAAREEIHKSGLPHREVHVWFYTPNGEIIFQHRAKDKDTYPDLLDATVGGHVEIGDSYERTAIKETEEETGVIITEADLIPIKKLQPTARRDAATGAINNAFKMQFAYLYKGDISDLVIEEGKIIGFETFPIQKLFNLQSPEKERFIPSITLPPLQEVFREIEKLLGKT